MWLLFWYVSSITHWALVLCAQHDSLHGRNLLRPTPPISPQINVHRMKPISRNFSSKEKQIAAIFKGVAYGGLSTNQLPSKDNPATRKNASLPQDIMESNDWKVSGNSSPSQSPKKQDDSLSSPDSGTMERAPEAFYMIDNALSKSLMQEIPEISEEFSIPELRMDVPESVPNELPNEPSSLVETFHTDIMERPQPTDQHISVEHPERIPTNPTILQSKGNISSPYNDLRSTRIKHSNVWIYHDYFVIVIFSMLLCPPLTVVVKIKIKKKQHITPNYCLWLMLNLVCVCSVRLVLYSVDPFGDLDRLGIQSVILLHNCVHWILVYSIGIFTIMMVFPAYRPKSQVLPCILLGIISFLLMSKMAYALICSYLSVGSLLYAYKSEVVIAALNFAEISALMASLIILMLCTRQKHKIWWIRMYKKCLNAGEGNICVLYSHLRRGLRFGSSAALLQFLSTLLIITNDFDLHRVNFPLTPASWSKWTEESLKRTTEGLICLLVALGANQFFVEEERRTIRERSSFKQFGDLLMGRRNSSKRSSNSSNKISLGIFTINRTPKAIDSATSDFQLVWNNDPSEATSSFIEDTKSKQTTWNSSSTLDVRKSLPIRSSSQLLKNVDLSRSGSNIYDNVTEVTPIYQNQYFKYLEKSEKPEFSEPQTSFKNRPSIMDALAMVNLQKKKKHDSRPKSLMLTDVSKFHDPYSTAYVSAHCISNYPLESVGPRRIMATPGTEMNNSHTTYHPMYGTSRLMEASKRHSTVSVSKANTLESTKRLHSSKSVDNF